MYTKHAQFSMVHPNLAGFIEESLTSHLTSPGGEKPLVVVEVEKEDTQTTLTMCFAKEEHARRATELFTQEKGRKTDLEIVKADGEWMFFFTVPHEQDGLVLDLGPASAEDLEKIGKLKKESENLNPNSDLVEKIKAASESIVEELGGAEVENKHENVSFNVRSLTVPREESENPTVRFREQGHTDEWLKSKIAEVDSSDAKADRDYFNTWTSDKAIDTTDKKLMGAKAKHTDDDEPLPLPGKMADLVAAKAIADAADSADEPEEKEEYVFGSTTVYEGENVFNDITEKAVDDIATKTLVDAAFEEVPRSTIARWTYGEPDPDDTRASHEIAAEGIRQSIEQAVGDGLDSKDEESVDVTDDVSEDNEPTPSTIRTLGEQDSGNVVDIYNEIMLRLSWITQGPTTQKMAPDLKVTIKIEDPLVVTLSFLTKTGFSNLGKQFGFQVSSSVPDDDTTSRDVTINRDKYRFLEVKRIGASLSISLDSDMAETFRTFLRD